MSKENPEINSEEKKRLHPAIPVAIVTLAVVAVLAGLYLAVAARTRGHFLKNTLINGHDCSSLTVEEVEELLRADAEQFHLSLRFRDGETFDLDEKDIAYRYVSDGSVQQILDAQDPLRWILPHLQKDAVAEHSVATATTYDPEALEAAVRALPPLQEENMVDPTDAELIFEGSSFRITPETEGSRLDIDRVLGEVQEAVDARAEELDLAGIRGLYTSPKVKADDIPLNAKMVRLNKYIAGSVTWDLPGGQRVLDGATTIQWLTPEGEDDYRKDEEVWNAHLEEYVAGLAEDINSIGGARTFQATGIGEITVSGGDYGWQLDTEAEKAQLAGELEAGTVITREPNYLIREFATENAGLGDTYIEVDLSRQHLWFYIDGELFTETDIVSGTMNEERWTPPGVFRIKKILPNVVLRGPKLPNGEYEYENPVKYWMPFNKGIGLHDAPWRGSFGGEIYVWSGSHGCVNLPTAAAATIYSAVTFETPVICYYSQPYSLH